MENSELIEEIRITYGHSKDYRPDLRRLSSNGDKGMRTKRVKNTLSSIGARTYQALDLARRACAAPGWGLKSD